MTGYVDHAEIKLGQLLTIFLACSALALQQTAPLFLLTVIFLLSGTLRPISPFTLLYQRVIKPLGVIRSDYRLDNIQPHKFGQLVGALTVALALGLIEYGNPFAGWAVVAVLVALTLTSYAGWCIGCFIYYQLNRMGLRGFFRHAPTDKSVVMGARPSPPHDEV